MNALMASSETRAFAVNGRTNAKELAANWVGDGTGATGAKADIDKEDFKGLKRGKKNLKIIQS